VPGILTLAFVAATLPIATAALPVSHGGSESWVAASAAAASPASRRVPPASTTRARTGAAAMRLPEKVVALYHMMWSNSGSPPLRHVPRQVNVVNLAFLQGDAPRLVGWGSQTRASFLSDARGLRARGVRIVASVGGEHGRVNIRHRGAFVRGVMRLNARLPLDGLDWDIERGTAMAAADVIWISRRLKALRGPNFAITLAPNGSNIDRYRAIAVRLHRVGALDMIGQQFYDAIVSKEAARARVSQLAFAGIPPSKIAVGMMVGSRNVYWTVADCVRAVRFVKARFPSMRGGYLWEHGRADTRRWARRLAPVLRT